MRGELPDEPEPVPIGSGRIHREGTDVTVVAVGHLVHDALAVAEELADEVSVEVFDPRSCTRSTGSCLRRRSPRRVDLLSSTTPTVPAASRPRSSRPRRRRCTRRAPEACHAGRPPIAFAVELECRCLPSREQLTQAIRASRRKRSHDRRPHPEGGHVDRRGRRRRRPRGVGDAVEPATVFIEVESEKATFEVEAGVAGAVAEILVAPGDVGNVGDVIARITEESG